MKSLIQTGVVALLATVSLACCSADTFKQTVNDAADNVNGAADNVTNAAENLNKAYQAFMDQLNKPGDHINTGISYWIELQRDGQKSRASSKNAFHSGDKIRFHIKPNIDAYAYIVMLQGSNGDSAVLFPTANEPAKKMVAGEEMIIPATEDDNAWLKFDNNPGTEVLRIVVSRKKIDIDSYEGTGIGGAVTIASADKSDNIPDESSVGMVVDEESDSKPSASRNLTVVTTKKHKGRRGETTVINGDPKKVLVVDIALSHKS